MTSRGAFQPQTLSVYLHLRKIIRLAYEKIRKFGDSPDRETWKDGFKTSVERLGA